MVTLEFLIKACLDPVQAALVLVIMLAYRGSHPVLVAGVTGATVAETIMTLAAAGYMWGELIAPRLVAALLQAAVLYWTVRIVLIAARRAGGALAARRLSSGCDTANGEAPRSAAAPMAPWHMRAFARRRVEKLHYRKMHPSIANQSRS